MGDKKERVDAAHRDGGTWTTGIALDAAGDLHYGNPNVVKGPLTDDMHFIWQMTTNVADPPTIWQETEGRTLDPSNNLSTTDTATGTPETDGALLGISNLVSYDDSGTQRIIELGSSDNGGRTVVRCTEDGSDDISLDSSDNFGGIAAYINGEVGIISSAELNTDLHHLYSGGGALGVDQDLFYSTSTDNGLNFDTPIEEIDAITVNFISANIYVRCKDTVLAYVYDDGGVQKYNEKILIVGQTHQMMAEICLSKRV